MINFKNKIKFINIKKLIAVFKKKNNLSDKNGISFNQFIKFVSKD